ncbi:MAG: glycerol-3-phosphate 1-O-acyltransferase PlsY [Candidatus Omnitrophica bacterium]|nr:glycerol-3-phosphate 1-O-acyltransferase PlsY [Candidatus Omnitrophota bacterium]MCM8802892.1 glycerol-3-phosphate 1-O-acyltransferase PlsY [Candidatus Omnitrophota bacterium]
MNKLYYFIFSYLFGSIPFGYLFCKIFKGIDIRKFGSGNIGATNVYRVCGWKVGIPVLILDILKGFLPVYIGKIFNFQNSIILFGGILSILGHSFSIFLKGKGGKGVSTSFGVVIGLFPFPALLSFILWIIIVFSTKYVSLGSIAGAFFLPIFTFFLMKDKFLFYVSIFIFIFILYTHRENIKRLLNKNENKINLPWIKK